MSLALLVFMAAGTGSMSSLLLLAVIGVVPPAIMVLIWKDPAPTMAEVFLATEERRS